MKSILILGVLYVSCYGKESRLIERENLGSSINTAFDELMPVISSDGKTLYFCRKSHPQNMGKFRRDDIWVSSMDAMGVWSKAVNVGPPLNNEYGNAVCSVTPDGNTLLVGGDYFNGDSLTKGIFISHMTADGWSIPKMLKIQNFYFYGKFTGFYLTNNDRALLMSIERDDSYGGLDIYVSFLGFYDVWTEPLNLGSIINTNQDEVSPYMAPDGVTLYFSSRGHDGYGDYDVYFTRRLDSTWQSWSKPVNLGPTINTSGGEANYFMTGDGEYAYFASTENSIGGWDIFRLKLPQEMKPIPIISVNGKIRNKLTNMPIEAKIYYQSLPDAKEIGNARSNASDGKYGITLPLGYIYRFYIESDDFISIATNVDARDSSNLESRTLDFELSPSDSLVNMLNNIDFLNLADDSELPNYLNLLSQNIIQERIFDKITINFDFNRFPLRDDSYPGLNYIIRLMNEYKDFRLAIVGHTDNIGGWDYNLKLSKKRAESVAEYLQTKGIFSNRVMVSGMGYDVPIADNDTEEGRTKNRRVVFILLKR